MSAIRAITTRRGSSGRAALLACALLALGAGAAIGQQPPAPEASASGPAGADPASDLVQQIQQDLADVDQALQEAADAEQAQGQLDRAREAHLQAIRDIEELLKQVKYTQSQSGGQGQRSGSQGSGGGVKGQPQPRENDASSAPTPSKGQADKQQEQQQQQAAGKQPPTSGAADGQRPDQPPGSEPPPPDPLGRFTRQDTDARWGLLPPKMQERLMNLHVDDVPERYRSWLEAYIHALNRLEQQSGASR